MEIQKIVGGALVAAAMLTTGAGADFFEGFEAPISWPAPPNTAGAFVTLSSGQWWTKNQSESAGLSSVFQGVPANFAAQAGTNNSYAAMNFNSGSGTTTLNTWLMTPEQTLNNGDTFSFWTRSISNNFPDRLQLRLSTNGASVNTGAGGTGVGDFGTLLLDINPNYQGQNGYPTVWTQFSVTVSGLGGPAQGRFAFRYFVENGGPTGTNSNYIGIDSVSYTQVPVPGALALLGVAGLCGSRRRR
ncbi:MAG: choice-of-anchor J domain-containing protein [Phycisphaeraceae bacterium]|nr:choice-of-anchor J domain-containing protein [Phycisphaeraceae bacterium]